MSKMLKAVLLSLSAFGVLASAIAWFALGPVAAVRILAGTVLILVVVLLAATRL